MQFFNNKKNITYDEVTSEVLICTISIIESVVVIV